MLSSTIFQQEQSRETVTHNNTEHSVQSWFANLNKTEKKLESLPIIFHKY